MGRRNRWIPAANTLVSITYRTVQGRYLLRPSPELNDVVLGVFGRAQRLLPIDVCAVSVLSNHLHILVVADEAERVADFMEYVGSNLAREVNRLTGWSGPVFHGRYSMIAVTDEEAAQIERFRYVLAQGCKENLVESLREWPGVSSVRALLDAEPLTGHWFDRSREYAARQKIGAPAGQQFKTAETLVLSPLPCWEDLPAAVVRERVRHIVREIEWQAAVERAQGGARPLGPRAILALHPHHRPQPIARSPAPLVHAATEAARRAFREAYSLFIAAFRDAAERLRRGDRDAPFPAGCFPPALPFVPGWRIADA